MALNKDFLLVIESSGLGDGEPDLGERLMKAFLKVLLESEEWPARIICMNSGVFLTTEGSPVLDVLKQCEETTKNYEGSEETLKHILQVEEKLTRLVAELN